MSRVFVTKRPCRRNERGVLEDTYDLSPAEKWGPLVDVLPRGNVPRDLNAIARQARVALADFGPDDHLLCVGDPASIAVCVMEASLRTGGALRLLQWNRRAGDYDSTMVRVE